MKTPITSRHDGTWKGFTVKDIVFLTMMSALTIVCSALTGPLHAIPIFGLPTMCIALFFAMFNAIALLKIRKPGTLAIMAIISGLITLPIHPSAMIFSTIPGFITEIIVLLIFKNYRRNIAIYIASFLLPIMQLPLQIFYYVLIMGRTFDATLRFSWIVVVVFLATIALSALGTMLGARIAHELIASGKMK